MHLKGWWGLIPGNLIYRHYLHLLPQLSIGNLNHMRGKSLALTLTIALFATSFSPTSAATPDCLFGGQVRNVSGQKSSCWIVNGTPIWFSFKKRAEDKLTTYEKTKLKAYKEIKNAAVGKSIKNIELKYVISKHLPAQLRTEYIRQTEQASKLYDQFFTRPVVVNNYFQTEKDAPFIKNHPVLKRDAQSFQRWYNSWPKGKETEHTVGLAAWFFKSGGKSEGHTGVLTASNGSIAKLRLYSHQVVAHEYFHVVQDFYKQSQDEIGYDGVSAYDIYYPPIFREGSANTIATAISMDSFEDYLLFYQLFLSQNKGIYAPKIFSRINNLPNTISLLKEIELKQKLDSENHEVSYSVGALVFEWLIAEYGFAGYKKLIENQLIGDSFADNLKASLGLTLDQLYKAAAPHVLAGFQAAKGSTR